MIARGCGRRAAVPLSAWMIAIVSGPATPAVAQDAPSWSGYYIGAHMGGALDLNNFSNPYGPTLFGDQVRSPGPFGGLQLGADWQEGQVVLGLQADVSGAEMGGTFTCMQPVRTPTNFIPQFVGGAFGATCQAEPSWFGTLTGRAGIAVGPQGRLLLYGKGGLAWAHTDIEMAINNLQAGFFGPNNAKSKSSFTQLGWTLGGGAELALSGRWSVGLEYDYLHFGDHDVATPQSGPFTDPTFDGIEGATAPDGRPASVSQDLHAVKVAVNYRFGDKPAAEPEVTRDSVAAPRTPGFETEFGGRYVYSWTRFQQDLGNGKLALPVNDSRLTWKDMGTNDGEFFWRIDTPENVMFKGFMGLGQGDQGHIFDEDWGVAIRNNAGDITEINGFQNTQSATTTKIHYLTLDLGYDWLRGQGYKVASYLGYNYFQYAMKAFGCTALKFSPPRVCDPTAPPRQLFLQEDDAWISWRLGTSAEIQLAPRLKLSGDVAYLPYVKYSGIDNHPLRIGDGPSTRSPMWGDGTGVQMEGVVSYDLTQAFSIGVGGRYWAMQIPAGTTNFFSKNQFLNQRYATEQTATFVQGSYKFSALSE